MNGLLMDSNRYVTYLEDRVRSLEATLNDQLLGSDPKKGRGFALFQSPQQLMQQHLPVDLGSSHQPDAVPNPQLSSPTVEGNNQGIPSELLPQRADGFDWAEEEVAVDEISDGMAALSVRPRRCRISRYDNRFVMLGIF